MSNSGSIPTKGSMEMCPMASMCKGMAKNPASRFLMMVPGIVLILIGILIIIEPRVLVWLMGIASILIGIIMLFFANFMRNMSTRFSE